MKILFIGGTKFIGLHMVEEALRRGHDVTIFTRGLTNMNLVPERVEKLTGNRDGDLAALLGREWDVVIDNCGYVPRIVKQSAQHFAQKNACQLYIFISTVGVYKSFDAPGVAEDAPMAECADPTVEEITGDTYCGLKVLCEQEVIKAFGGEDKCLLIRPGYIVGPYDGTDRFTYWPHRICQGGEVMAPVSKQTAFQAIDARDLATFTLNLAEKRQTGSYNVTGPLTPMTMGEFFNTCQHVVGESGFESSTTASELDSAVQFTWVDDKFIAENKVSLPLYHAPGEGMDHIMAVSIDKAIQTGALSCRPQFAIRYSGVKVEDKSMCSRQDRHVRLKQSC